MAWLSAFSASERPDMLTGVSKPPLRKVQVSLPPRSSVWITASCPISSAGAVGGWRLRTHRKNTGFAGTAALYRHSTILAELGESFLFRDLANFRGDYVGPAALPEQPGAGDSACSQWSARPGLSYCGRCYRDAGRRGLRGMIRRVDLHGSKPPATHARSSRRRSASRRRW
jgi:hypothetical protein